MDPLVELYLGGLADGDDATEVEHHDPVGEVHHEVHLVLDQDRGDVQLTADLQDVVGRLLGLLLVHARHWFVEEEQPGFHRQRPPELDPLLDAVGQGTDGHRAIVGEVEEVGDLGAAAAVGLLLATRLAVPQRAGDRAGTSAGGGARA